MTKLKSIVQLAGLCLASIMLLSISEALANKRQSKTKILQNQQKSHRKAYQKPRTKKEHINIKVTPPEVRGRKGYVLVEIFNFSKKDIALIDFDLKLQNRWGDLIEADIDAEDMAPNWSSPVWVKIPGKGKIEKITAVKVERFEVFQSDGKRIKLPYSLDLIKY